MANKTYKRSDYSYDYDPIMGELEVFFRGQFLDSAYVGKHNPEKAERVFNLMRDKDISALTKAGRVWLRM